MDSSSGGAAKRYVLIAIAVVIVLAATMLGYLQGASYFKETAGYPARMSSCEHDTRSLAKMKDDGAAQENSLSIYCYNDIRRVNVLEESSIRRDNFVHQRLENDIILAMVVIITFSGVALSGVQLFTSYRLASLSGVVDQGLSSELVVERNRLSLKSSVTGVITLGLSLGFFIVYVVWVYTLTDVGTPDMVETDGSTNGPPVAFVLPGPPVKSSAAPAAAKINPVFPKNAADQALERVKITKAPLPRGPQQFTLGVGGFGSPPGPK